MSKKGFTLIELLIVITIMAILAGVAFVAINPALRFKDSRDSVRWQTVSQLLRAVKLYQVDHGGQLSSIFSGMTSGTVYMITQNSVTSGCASQNSFCATPVSSNSACVNLSEFVTAGYFAELPISPKGQFNWRDSNFTGYTIEIKSGDNVVIRACENENSSEIKVAG